MVGFARRKKSFFITGANRSNLSQIIQRNLPKNRIEIRQEPPEEKQFFERSDNYPFAQKGVVAHSIMTTDDEDACYHRPCDDVERIDFGNLQEILSALMTGLSTIVKGEEDPR